MRIVLNGESTDVPSGATAADAVAAAGVSEAGRGVAVAVAGEVVPRAAWSERELSEGDQVEVVHAVQGG